MKEGQIIKQSKLKHESEMTLRLPKKDDAKAAMNFINEIVKEDPMISINKPQKIEDEEKWIQEAIEGIYSGEKIVLMAELKNSIIGVCEIRKKKYKESHVGTLGISILQSFRGKGLGKEMINTVIEMAKKNMKLEIIELSVLADNKVAIDLYKKLGFQYTGNIPRGIKHRGKYIDSNIMVKIL